MAKVVMLSNPTTGVEKKGFYGFSWTTFFWGGFPAIFRGDLVTGIVLMLLNCVTFWVAGIIWSFVYNKKYTVGLLEKGYVFNDRPEVVAEAKEKLGIREGSYSAQ